MGWVGETLNTNDYILKIVDCFESNETLVNVVS